MAAFPMQKLIDYLSDEGFPVNNIEIRIKIYQFVRALRYPGLVRFAKLRLKLSALICKSKEDQKRFCAVFNRFARQYLPNQKEAKKRSARGDSRPPRTDRSTRPDQHFDPSYTADDVPVPPSGESPLVPVPPLHAARKEPLSIQIILPENPESIWEWSEIAPIARMLREKEITPVEELDIPATIYKTIRSGGSPQFIRRHRKRWQDYLFLIEQRSEKDHLAAYYAELVVALQRMDINADYFFFNHVPSQFWKERCHTDSYLPIEKLYSEYVTSKVFIIAAPEVLLERPVLKPSSLAIEMQQIWPNTGLLNTRPTTDWNNQEESLAHFMPVAPGTLAGLESMFRQWETRLAHTPYYWKLQAPEPALPVFVEEEEEIDDTESVLQEIAIYLGKTGFLLLYAVALFPQMYWELTKSYRDILYSTIPTQDNEVKKKVWQGLLLRISRLKWFRLGSIPSEVRTLLRKQKNYASYSSIREKLIELLSSSENLQPEGSYAEAERFFALALLNYEKNIHHRPQEKTQLADLLNSQLRSQHIHFTEISDPAGRSAYEDIAGVSVAAASEEVQKTEELSQTAKEALLSGDQALSQSDLAKAKTDYELALSSAEAASNLQLIAETQQKLAGLSQREGDHYGASNHLELRVQTLKQLGNSQQIAQGQWDLAKTLLEAGDLTEARKMFISAIQLFRRLGLMEQARAAEIDLADLEKEAGDISKAISILHKIIRELPPGEALLSVLQEKTEALKDQLLTQKAEGIPTSPRYVQFNNTSPSKTKAWERLKDAFDKGTFVKGSIEHRLVKGGLVVNVENLELFLPASQVELSLVNDLTPYFGRENLLFKVVKVNEHLRNAVVSRKEVLLGDYHSKRADILNNLSLGQIIEGRVKNITGYGAFIDMGGVDGLIYITDLSWGRVNHPRDIVKLGQTLQVKIIDFTPDKKRIALSVKELFDNPWRNIPNNAIFEGVIIEGKIVNVEDYGVFVEIVHGVEGLVHYKELSWTDTKAGKKELAKKYRKGEKVKIRIVTIDTEQRKMSVSIKQATTDPWESITPEFIGTKHKGKVNNINNYGVFIHLDSELSGMLHISDISWSKRYAHPSEFISIGDEIDVVVLSIDRDKRQLQLGHKQLTENPWEQYAMRYSSGSYHEGTVTRVDNKGYIILLGNEVDAFAPKKYIKKEDGTILNKDETALFKVIEIDPNAQKIVVSVSHTP
jgi:ribosomal protein S1